MFRVFINSCPGTFLESRCVLSFFDTKDSIFMSVVTVVVGFLIVISVLDLSFNITFLFCYGALSLVPILTAC